MSFNPFEDDSLFGDLQLNPYRSGEPIQEDSEFVGRQKELRRLASVTRVQSSGFLFLLGDFRIGKSSILNRLAKLVQTTPEAQRKDRSGNVIVTRFFTCEELAVSSARSIIERIAAILAEEISGDPPTSGLEGVFDGLRRAAASRRHFVFLIDEAGLLPSVAGSSELIRALPEMINSFPVHFILAGPFEFKTLQWDGETEQEKKLREISARKLARSMETIRVTDFSISDAVHLIRLSERLYGPERSLRGFEEAILEISGTIPYVIQTACRELYDILYEDPETNLSPQAMEERSVYLEENPRQVIQDDPRNAYLDGERASLGEDRVNALQRRVYDQLAGGYFDQLWNYNLSEAERQILIKGRVEVDVEKLPVTAPEHSLLDRGYLRQRGNRLWIFSTLFEQYIRVNHHRTEPAPPPLVWLTGVEGPEDENRGIVPPILTRYALHFQENQTSLGDRERSYQLYLAHLLAFLSQLAISAYGAQPALHRPELNIELKQRRYRDATHGTRLGYLREILRADQLHDQDLLFDLKTCLFTPRKGEECPPGIRAFVHAVTDQRGTKISLLDFLDCCVRLRTLQVHAETKAFLTHEMREDLLVSAWSGLMEFLGLLARETSGLAVVELGTVGADDPSERKSARLHIAFRPRFGVSPEPAEADVDSRPVAGRLFPGELYPCRVAPAVGAGRTRQALFGFSLFPHIVRGEQLSGLIGGSDAPPEELYMVISAAKNRLLYVPVGNPEGKRLEVRTNGSDRPHDPIRSYSSFFEEL